MTTFSRMWASTIITLKYFQLVILTPSSTTVALGARSEALMVGRRAQLIVTTFC